MSLRRTSSRRRRALRGLNGVRKVVGSVTLARAGLALLRRRRAMAVIARTSPAAVAIGLVAAFLLRRRRRREELPAPNQSAPGAFSPVVATNGEVSPPEPRTPSEGAPDLDLGPPNESAPGHEPDPEQAPAQDE